MGQSVRPEEGLFDISEEDVMSIPPVRVKTILSVLIPTPSGVVAVSRPEVNTFWSVSIHDIVKPPGRLKNMSALDIEMRRAVYVAVLHLHDTGCLSPSNQPSVRAKAESKIACPAFYIRDRLNLKMCSEKVTGRKALLDDFEQSMESSVEKYEELIDYARQFYRGATPMFHALTWRQTLEMRVKWDRDLQLKWLEGQNR